LVAAFYNQNASEEHSRLADRSLERSVTMNVILDTMAASNGTSLKIADIGGGTGIYAVELARLGHEVTLTDISASELDIARDYAKYAHSQIVYTQGLTELEATTSVWRASPWPMLEIFKAHFRGSRMSITILSFFWVRYTIS
jgi:2-polyprenyl-3-methyl-5-hydroxy-6-metoxy-1,4-benzoquinol methylase